MNAEDVNGLHVLIIDDEKDFACTLASRLELRGVQAVCAFNGEDGLVRLREELPDVVLLDMRMPGLSGVEVLERIRMDYPDLPVMIVSGHCSQHDKESAEDLGVLAFYPKPLQFRELLAAFAAMRGKRG